MTLTSTSPVLIPANAKLCEYSRYFRSVTHRIIMLLYRRFKYI